MIGEPVRLAGNWHHRLALRARACVFAGAVLVGAATVGGIFAFIGSSLLISRHVIVDVIVVLVLAAAIGRDGLGVPIPVPRRRWQVPRSWMSHFWGGAITFGLAMGAGLFTYTPSFTYYLYLLVCLLIGTAQRGAWVGALFGASYVAAVYLSTAAWRSTRSPDKTERAMATARVARVVGAVASPLILAIPAAWIALQGLG